MLRRLETPLLTAAPIALAIALAVSGCDNESPTNPTLNEGPVEWTVLLDRALSSFEDQTRRVVRTEAEFQAAWDDLFADIPMPDPLPVVDFNNDMVVVVGSGEQSTSCHEIEVVAAVSDGSDIEISVDETGPTDQCMCAMMTTSPVEVVRLPRADGVRFSNRTVRVCNS